MQLLGVTLDSPFSPKPHIHPVSNPFYLTFKPCPDQPPPPLLPPSAQDPSGLPAARPPRPQPWAWDLQKQPRGCVLFSKPFSGFLPHTNKASLGGLRDLRPLLPLNPLLPPQPPDCPLDTRYAPASAPLLLLFPPPGMLFPQLSAELAPLYLWSFLECLILKFSL